MTQTADMTAATVTTDQPTKPTVDDATAIAQAKAPAPQTKTITVQPVAFDVAGAWSYRFYKADPHGATPNQWRCAVLGPGGVNGDVPAADAGIDVAVLEAHLARAFGAVVTS